MLVALIVLTTLVSNGDGGEAGVLFYTISGCDIIEMIVGVDTVVFVLMTFLTKLVQKLYVFDAFMGVMTNMKIL